MKAKGIPYLFAVVLAGFLGNPALQPLETFAAPTYSEVNLSAVANGNIPGSYSPAPSGSPITLAGIPFWIPATPPSGLQTSIGADASYVAATGVQSPTAVHLLINSGNSFYGGGSIPGNVRVNFTDGTHQTTTLVLGQNIREWAAGTGLPVPPESRITTDPNSVEVWRADSGHGLQTAVIDRLRIPLTTSEGKTLSDVTINDTSAATNGDGGHMSILVAAITVEGGSVASVDLSGRWDLTDTTSGGGVFTHVFDFLATGQNTYTFAPPASCGFAGDATLLSSSITFTGTYCGGGLSATWTGAVNLAGTQMSGTWTQSDGQFGTFVATKQGQVLGAASYQLPWPPEQAYYYWCGPHSIASSGCPTSGEAVDFAPVSSKSTTGLAATACDGDDRAHRDDFGEFSVTTIGSGKVLRVPQLKSGAQSPTDVDGRWKIALGTWSGSTFNPSGLMAVYEHVRVDVNDLPAVGAPVAAGVEIGRPSCIGASARPHPANTHVHFHIGFYRCTAASVVCANDVGAYSPISNLAGSDISMCGWSVQANRSLARSITLLPIPQYSSAPVTCALGGGIPATIPQTSFITPGLNPALAFVLPQSSTGRGVIENYSGSLVRMKVISPSGIEFDFNSPGYIEGSGFAYVAVSPDETGQWLVELTGVDVPPGGEQVRVQFLDCAADAEGSAGDPCNADDDGDGLSDNNEAVLYATDPLLFDSDGDGLSDGLEVAHACLGPEVSDASQDPDVDGVSNIAELEPPVIGDTGNPCEPDTDGDVVCDGPLNPTGLSSGPDNCVQVPNPTQINIDAATLTTPSAPNDTTIPNADALGDACDSDDDNDGIADATETAGAPCASATAATNPLLQDTDGDRMIDGAECTLGTNPNDSLSKLATIPPGDADQDGLPDAFEAQIGTSTSTADVNGDGKPDGQDTDGDSIRDGLEYRGYGTSPLATDSDLDGCEDGLEIGSVDTNKIPNSIDLLIIALQFNRTDRPVQDIDKNGIVNSNDLSTTVQQFNKLC